MTILLTSDLPTRDTQWHDESNVLLGNALTKVFSASQRHGMYSYQNAAQNGDTFTTSVFLRTGVYTLTILGVTDANNGLMDIYLDGSPLTAGIDWYSGAITYNVEKTVSGISIIAAGKHVLKFSVNGKNGASGGYRLYLTKFSLKGAVD